MNNPLTKLKNKRTAYFLLRIGIGLSMFGHGLVRLPKLSVFADSITQKFTGAIVPDFMVHTFAYTIPFLELIAGISLVLGFFTRFGSVIGGATLLMLIFGTTMIEDWSILPSQLIHLLFFVIVLWNLEFNWYSLDHLMNKDDYMED